VNYDLATMPALFNTYYTFSQAYSFTGTLDTSFAELAPELVTNGVKHSTYINQYNSGNNSGGARSLRRTGRSSPVVPPMSRRMISSSALTSIEGWQLATAMGGY